MGLQPVCRSRCSQDPLPFVPYLQQIDLPPTSLQIGAFSDHQMIYGVLGLQLFYQLRKAGLFNCLWKKIIAYSLQMVL